MPDTQNKYQSFRLACDRCRSHKLRCPQNKPSTNAGACERCLRAKVQCTFSPRARTGRPTERKPAEGTEGEPTKNRKRRKQLPTATGGDTRSCSSREGTPDDDLHDAPSPASRRDHSYESMTTTDMTEAMWGGYSNFQPPPAPSQTDITDLNTSKFNLDSMVDFINGTEMSTFLMPDSTVGSSTPASLHETQLGTTPGPWDMRHSLDFMANSPGATHAIMPSTSTCEGINPEASSSSESSQYDGDDCARKLSALTLAFRRHLSRVNHGLRTNHDMQQDGQECLKNYPIGDIIQLSQELITVLRSLSVNAVFHPDSEHPSSAIQQIHKLQDHGGNFIQNPTSRPEMAHQNKLFTWPISPASDTRRPSVLGSAQPSFQVDIDTPTALLILNCHVSLVQIYTTVFARLHQYLDSLPPSGSSGAIVPQLPGLQFGELPPSDDAYTRAHASYRILLDTLARSEEILHLPREFRCVQVRENSSVGLQSDLLGRSSGISIDRTERSESCSSSGDSGSPPGVTGGAKVSLVEMKLVEAVWQHEAWSNGGLDGDSGLNLLRKNISRVKRTLRRKMAL